MFRLALIVIIVFCICKQESADAQEMEDVITLKDGSILRGMLIETIPDSTTRIQLLGGSEMVIQMDQVVKITKEPKHQVVKITKEPKQVIVTDSKPNAGKRKEHSRAGWMLGFSGGGGPGNFTDGVIGNKSSSEGGAIGNFRVGRMIHPKFLIHVESQVYIREETDPTGKATFSFANVAIAGTLYPGDPTQPSGGFYLRGGIGPAEAAFDVTVGRSKTRFKESGFGILVGLGYEFRLTRRFALGVGAGYNKLFINETILDSVQFGQFVLDFNWYLGSGTSK